MPQYHGILSAYYGDNEWDIGKSVRWLQYFCDTEFGYDMNAGDGEKSRQYFVDWNRSFSDVKFEYANTTFFGSLDASASWRAQSFAKADELWEYDADDWVVFVDCSEGLCLEEDPALIAPVEGLLPEPDAPPPDPDDIPPLDSPESIANPFQVYLANEIAQAESEQPGATRIFLPVWAFLYDSAAYAIPRVIDSALQTEIDAAGPDDIINGLSKAEAQAANTTYTATCRSYYAFAGYSPRIFKVSELRNFTTLDWKTIDTYYPTAQNGGGQATVATDPLLSIISYAYARWSSDPSKVSSHPRLPNDQTTDEGWKMRQKISTVRPITGLEVTTWAATGIDSTSNNEEWGYFPTDLDPQNATSHDGGTPPADSIGSFDQEFSTAFSSAFRSFATDGFSDPTQYSWPAGFPELYTPLYDNIFRENVRDGLWYRDGDLGPVPWNFISGQAADIDPQDASQIPKYDYFIGGAIS